MTHLSTEQLVDILEGAAPAASPHLQECASCRQQLGDLRAMMSVVTEVEVPEPSPLFWDHLSSRVHDAVEAERQSPARRLANSWMPTRPVVWIPGVAVIALAAIVGTWVNPAPQSSSPADAVVVEAVDVIQVPDDPSLSLVADLAADLDWDAVAEAGFTGHVGVGHDVVMQLSDDERRALGELLRMELGQRGRRGA